MDDSRGKTDEKLNIRHTEQCRPGMEEEDREVMPEK